MLFHSPHFNLILCKERINITGCLHIIVIMKLNFTKMKRINILRLQIFAFLLTAILLFSSCKSESDSQGPDKMMSGSMSQRMNASMKMMMDDMKDYNITGDPDYDFAMLMTPHHQAAIDMSKTYLDGGNNHELKDFAQKNIDIQQKEIIDMKDWMARQYDFKPGAIDPNYKKQIDKLMMDMSNNMTVQNNDNTNLMYASMMIPHHQTAIELAKIEQEFGKTSRMKELADKIIDEQQEDIKTLQGMKSGMMSK